MDEKMIRTATATIFVCIVAILVLAGAHDLGHASTCRADTRLASAMHALEVAEAIAKSCQ